MYIVVTNTSQEEKVERILYKEREKYKIYILKRREEGREGGGEREGEREEIGMASFVLLLTNKYLMIMYK